MLRVGKNGSDPVLPNIGSFYPENTLPTWSWIRSINVRPITSSLKIHWPPLAAVHTECINFMFLFSGEHYTVSTAFNFLQVDPKLTRLKRQFVCIQFYMVAHKDASASAVKNTISSWKLTKQVTTRAVDSDSILFTELGRDADFHRVHRVRSTQGSVLRLRSNPFSRGASSLLWREITLVYNRIYMYSYHSELEMEAR